jgi:hypothetical protein
MTSVSIDVKSIPKPKYIPLKLLLKITQYFIYNFGDEMKLHSSHNLATSNPADRLQILTCT